MIEMGRASGSMKSLSGRRAGSTATKAVPGSMGATLGIANERNAYTLTDRGTYLALRNSVSPLRNRVSLRILIEGDRALLNIYSVVEVNPANGPRINSVGGKAFADFMVAPETQNVIRNFGKKFGQSLFIPVAGKKEDDLGTK